MPKKNLYLTLIVVVILTAVSAYGWYFSYGSAVNSLRSVQNVSDETSLHEKELEKRKAASIVEEAIKEDITLLAKSFVGKDEIVTLVEYLENLGRKTGVVVSTKSFTDEKDFFTFDISVRGSFSDVYLFVYAMETSRYALSIQKATFHSGEKGMWDASIQFKLLTKI